MTYPTSYDDDSVLYGDLADQKTLVLRAPCTDVDTLLLFETTVGVVVNTFLRIEDEIVSVVTVNATSLEVVRDPAKAAAYDVGTNAFLILTAEHLNVLRDRAIETQKYQGLRGDDADKPASPVTSEVYVALDTQKVYVCIVAGQWSLLGGATAHADVLLEGETDDHAQYYTESRLTDWHNGLSGEHVTDGDDHDHRVGGGAGRVKTATSGTLPNKDTGYVRLATDTAELYVGTGPTTWAAITGAPSGVIMILQEADVALYGGNCPTGWSRYTALDGKFPKGAPTGVASPLNTGGMSTHVHTYSQVPAHVHSIPEMAASLSSAGSHDHSFSFATLASGTGLGSTAASNSNGSFATNAGGAHTHSVSYPANTTGSSGGSASASSSSVSSLPPYKEVVFCKKD